MDTYSGLLSELAELGHLLLPVVYVLALALGVIFAGIALHKLKHLGDERHRGATWPGFFGSIAASFGSVLLYAVCKMASKDYGSIASGVSSQMAYIKEGSSSNLKPMWEAIYIWMLLIGICAVWRSFLLLSKAGNGQGNGGDHIWQAVWHFLGGAIVINIASRVG